jgi:diacylglycerol kinase (ATP)
MKEVPHACVPQRFTLVARLKSFGYAFEGIALMLKTQHNAWLHLLATALVTGLAGWCRVDAGDWRWLIGAMTMVWMAEAMNTAVESLCDVVSPQYSLAVKCAKDLAAGGVLIAAGAAAATGVITFWPYLGRVP